MGTWGPTSTVTGVPMCPPLCTITNFVGSSEPKKNTKKTKRKDKELCKDEAKDDQAKPPPLKRSNQSSDGGSDDNSSCEWCYYLSVSNGGTFLCQNCFKKEFPSSLEWIFNSRMISLIFLNNFSGFKVPSV